MRIVELNEANLQAVDSIANPDNIVYFSIDFVRLVEESSARLALDGKPYGHTFEVGYRLAMRHQNALPSLAQSHTITSSNLITDILCLGLSGMEAMAMRDAYHAGRNIYYLMSVGATAIVAYPAGGANSTPVHRVIVKINPTSQFTVDIDSNESEDKK